MKLWQKIVKVAQVVTECIRSINKSDGTSNRLSNIKGKDNQGRYVSIIVEHMKLYETSVLAKLLRAANIPDIYSVTEKCPTKDAS